MSDVKKPTVSLSSIKSVLVPSKSTVVEYPGMPGFKVSLAYLSREVLQKIRKKATTQTFKKNQVIEELNDDLFLELYVQETITGWKGFKLSYLEQLAPVNLEDQDTEAELEYTPENALFLMKSSIQFDNWVNEKISDLGNFRSATKS